MSEIKTSAETFTISIDGKEIEAGKGEMIIAAADRAGVYIPRFCYHPRMKPVGMCRMCLVEVVGPRGPQLQPACYVPVADGQEIVTQSPAVKKAQDGVLEFLLANHPLDCPVCDKGGECPLQDQTFAFGPGETRFVEEKRHWEKPIPLSDLVLIDRERCIQCARCTRFADEIAGDPQISFVDRGDHTEVAIAEGHPFDSYFSGNTVQICPVGALLATPYRFKARPWDLEQVETTCTVCAVGCRMAAQSSGNELTRYLGVDSDPVNQGWLCDKGRFSYEAVSSADRLIAPHVRAGEDLAETSWAEALDAAARGLSDVRSVHGASAIGVIGGARLANEAAYAWAKLAKSVLGTDNVDAQLGDGLPAEAVLGLPRATIDDACAASVVVLLAPDVKEELPVLYLRLRLAALEDGVALVELTPAATGLSRICRASLRYRPGEVAELVEALVGQGDGDVAGIPAAQIAEVRTLLRTSKPVVVLGRPSVAESGESVARAAAALAEALPGARFLPALRRGNVHGALDMGLAPGVLPGRISLDDGRRWFEGQWGAVPEARGMDATAMLEAAADGRLQALVLVGADPLADFPDRQLARRAVAGAGFVVSVDTFLSESTRAADVVLPATMAGEHGGTTTNMEGRVSRLGPKVVAPGVCWPDWMIASELASRLGGDLALDDLDAITDEIARVAPTHAGVTRSFVAGRRDGVVVPVDEAKLTPGREAAVQDPTANPGVSAVEDQGPTDTLTAVDDDDAGVGGDADDESGEDATPAPAVARPSPLRFRAPDATGEAPPLDSYSLRLVSGRVAYDGGAVVRHAPALAALIASPVLRANPYDLDRLGIGAGGEVRVSSARTSFVAEARADEGVPRGSVALAFNLPGEGAGELIDVSQPVTDVRLENI